MYKRDEEDSGERLDRHWAELLQELRLAQTGTQILFAFLLSIAFQNAFHSADDFTHIVYAVTLIASALAVAMLLAPVAVHRMLYQQGLRDQLIRISDRLARGGLVFLVAAICGGVLIALDVVLSRTLSIIVVAVVLTSFVILWLAIPAAIRHRYRHDPET
ncbi:DUF6328 family protein [Kribbella sp. NPDC026611]|uniref:DUF6328 family protein n=1 Tax=Kribbella sp. NPDC026611 TaxID=3154911 RepID=UPI0033E61277